MNISGGFLQSLRFGAAGGGFACPPPAPLAGGCPPPPPPVGGCPPPPPPAGGCHPPLPSVGGCPPPSLPAGGCPPPSPPVGGCSPPLPPAGGCAGIGAGAGVGGTFRRTTLPLAMCAASLECVCMAIVGSIGDC